MATPHSTISLYHLYGTYDKDKSTLEWCFSKAGLGFFVSAGKIAGVRVQIYLDVEEIKFSVCMNDREKMGMKTEQRLKYAQLRMGRTSNPL